MPKSEGHVQKAARELKYRLSVQHLYYNTNVFKPYIIGEPDLDPRTVEVVKARFTRWFASWVAEDLDTVLKHANKKLYEKENNKEGSSSHEG